MYGSFQASESTALTKPTLPELLQLHKELGLWIAHTRYEMTNVDQRPVWRVQNTSMLLASGSGITTYHLVKRVRPGIRFPLDMVPAFVFFYMTHRAAQAVQMPGLYESVLALPSPLGSQAQKILRALRGDGKLPSSVFGAELPASRGGVAGSAVERGIGEPSAPVPLEQDGGGGGAFGRSAAADPWAATDGSDGLAPPSVAPPRPNGEAAPDWGWGGDGFGTGNEKPERPARRTWDEIRAKAAQSGASQ